MFKIEGVYSMRFQIKECDITRHEGKVVYIKMNIHLIFILSVQETLVY